MMSFCVFRVVMVVVVFGLVDMSVNELSLDVVWVWICVLFMVSVLKLRLCL